MAAPQIDVTAIKEKLGIGPDKVYGAIGEFSTPDELVAAGKKVKAMLESNGKRGLGGAYRKA